MVFFEGLISMGQVLTVQPFGNIIDVIKIKGQYIWEAFEHSVAKYDPDEPPGAFLQVSGERFCSVSFFNRSCKFSIARSIFISLYGITYTIQIRVLQLFLRFDTSKWKHFCN